MKKLFLFSALILALAFLSWQTFNIYGQANIIFTEEGGTQEICVITSYEDCNVTVNIPANFVKIETAHFDKNKPDNIRKYMGWQGRLEVNSQTLWNFVSWSSSTGGIDYDGSLQQEVKDSSGIGLWIDATSFFTAGENKVVFTHNNEGTIGLRIKITTGDSGISKKSNGSSCVNNDECESTNCLNEICCEAGQNCCQENSSCQEGYQCSGNYYCTAKNYENGTACTSHADCQSSNCQNSICCEAGRTCCTTDSFCGEGYQCLNNNCILKTSADGTACSANSECQGGYCVHEICRSSSTYCGDTACDSGENCSSCASDCGVCPTAKKVEDGKSCSTNTDCKSGNCTNGQCCIKGKTCCTETKQCPLDQYCSSKRQYCVPGLPVAQKCTKKEECLSGNCQKGICCAWGETCCQKYSECKKNQYCLGGEVCGCRDKWNIGEKCSGPQECKSGYCDLGKCIEAPKETAQTNKNAQKKTENAPTKKAPVVSTKDIILFVPNLISLKKGEENTPLISIQNLTQKEITLGDNLIIENTNSNSIKIDPKTLQIFGKILKSGEKVSTDEEQLERSIEQLTITGQKEGTSELNFKAPYFIDNKAKWLTGKISVLVSDIHIKQEKTATEIFKEKMLLEETRKVKDQKNGKVTSYIFVSPELGFYEETLKAWQEANSEVNQYLDNLIDDFTGSLTPSVLSFLKSVKDLNEAKTQEEITEKTIRSIAPSPVLAGFDLSGLNEAIKKQNSQEQAFLSHFSAKEFVYIPIYKNEKIIGYSKAIIKKGKGKIYAVKIGDL